MAHVHAANADGTTPLFNAAERGHCRVCEVLVAAGACVGASSEFHFTPLHIANTTPRAQFSLQLAQTSMRYLEMDQHLSTL